MKDDEKMFLIDLLKQHKLGSFDSPRDLINDETFYMEYKRAWYLLEKWTNKGWYEYGVSVDLGWLTAEGIRQANKLMEGGLERV